MALNPRKIRFFWKTATESGSYSLEDLLILIDNGGLRKPPPDGAEITDVAYGDLFFTAAHLKQEENMDACAACQVMKHFTRLDFRSLCDKCSEPEDVSGLPREYTPEEVIAFGLLPKKEDPDINF
jgi:hypothetical protein